MGVVSDSRFHVLAVDDSLIDRKLIERLLKTSSFQVTTVDSGSKALEFLGLRGDEPSDSIPSVSPNNYQEVEVNLVITDYCMPGMTGYDLLKKIKGSTALRNIPVVIMSSENVPSRINRCLEEGAEEFFLKPVRLSDVNRLRPHMMKTKSKDEKQANPENETPVSGNQSPSPQQEQLRLLMPRPTPAHEQEQLQLLPPLPTPPPPQQQQQEQLRLLTPRPTPVREQEQLQLLPLAPGPGQEQLQILPPLPTPSQQSNNNKRKALEEGLSPDRTRPRYNGITTMV